MQWVRPTGTHIQSPLSTNIHIRDPSSRMTQEESFWQDFNTENRSSPQNLFVPLVKSGLQNFSNQCKHVIWQTSILTWFCSWPLTCNKTKGWREPEYQTKHWETYFGQTAHLLNVELWISDQRNACGHAILPFFAQTKTMGWIGNKANQSTPVSPQTCAAIPWVFLQ